MNTGARGRIDRPPYAQQLVEALTGLEKQIYQSRCALETALYKIVEEIQQLRVNLRTYKGDE